MYVTKFQHSSSRDGRRAFVGRGNCEQYRNSGRNHSRAGVSTVLWVVAVGVVASAAIVASQMQSLNARSALGKSIDKQQNFSELARLTRERANYLGKTFLERNNQKYFDDTFIAKVNADMSATIGANPFSFSPLNPYHRDPALSDEQFQLANLCQNGAYGTRDDSAASQVVYDCRLKYTAAGTIDDVIVRGRYKTGSSATATAIYSLSLLKPLTVVQTPPCVVPAGKTKSEACPMPADPRTVPNCSGVTCVALLMPVSDTIYEPNLKLADIGNDPSSPTKKLLEAGSIIEFGNDNIVGQPGRQMIFTIINTTGYAVTEADLKKSISVPKGFVLISDANGKIFPSSDFYQTEKMPLPVLPAGYSTTFKIAIDTSITNNGLPCGGMMSFGGSDYWLYGQVKNLNLSGTIIPNPFGDPAVPSPNGPQIMAKLYDGNSLASTSWTQKVNDFIKPQFDMNVLLSLSDLNVPERDFTQGFGANPLKRPGTNTVLMEWFAIEAFTHLKLDTDNANASLRDQPGFYQLAIMSDDGGVIYAGDDILTHGTANEVRTVDNDGVTSPRIRCANKLIEVKDNTRVPILVDYFQGPATQIALQVLWRKVNPASFDAQSRLFDQSICDKNAGHNSDFMNMLNGKSWKILDPKNFELVVPVEKEPYGCSSSSPNP